MYHSSVSATTTSSFVGALITHDLGGEASTCAAVGQDLIDEIVRGLRPWPVAPELAPEPEAAGAEPEPEESMLSDAQFFMRVKEAFDTYTVLPEHGSTIITLWAAHTHLLDGCDHSPRLLLTSPTYGCGKTTVFEILQHLVRNPFQVVNINVAGMFRLMEAEHPTLLCDEFDSLEPDQRAGLRNVINAGHARSGVGVVRCDPNTKGFKLKKFRVWGAIAIGMVGVPQRSIRQRSITLEMQRKRPDDRVSRLLKADRVKLAAMGKELKARVKRLDIPEDPELPPELDNRVADNWRPLIAIADAIGGEWPGLAREAALALEGVATARNLATDDQTLLLADIRRILRREQVAAKGYIETKMLVSALQNLAERPWKHLTDRELGRRLGHGDGGFGIGPVNPDHRQIRDDKRKVRGWRVEWFADVFLRYLPPETDEDT